MAPRPIQGASVVITGASSGIGRATAEAFASRGARLTIAARDGGALESVARRCRQLGGAVTVAPTDVTDIQAARDLALTAEQRYGAIDVWVSNVGIGAVGRFQDTPPEAHARVVQASLVSHMHEAHAVLPIFLRQRRGVFVNMVSLGAFAPVPFAAAYSASKFGLRGFGEALRAELADEPDIHVCDVYPGFVDAPGLSHAGNYIGRQLTAPPPVLDPARVASAIVRLAQRPRHTTMLGVTAHLARLGHVLAPNLQTRALAWLMKRHFRHAPRVQVQSGNLFSPPDHPGGIRGGLAMAPATKAGLIALGGLSLLALWALASRRG